MAGSKKAVRCSICGLPHGGLQSANGYNDYRSRNLEWCVTALGKALAELRTRHATEDENTDG